MDTLFDFSKTTDVKLDEKVYLYFSILDSDEIDLSLEIASSILFRTNNILNLKQVKTDLIVDGEAMLLESDDLISGRELLLYRNSFLEHGMSARLTN